MSEPQIGYLYRVPSGNAPTLRSIVKKVVGTPCWTFGGASVWDMQPAKRRDNLRPIAELAAQEAIDTLDVSGDFGHAFSPTAEVRWKRVARDSYDMLILSESLIEQVALESLGSFNVRVVPPKIWMYLDMPGGTTEREQRWRLGCVEYLGENQAVWLVRYTQLDLREESRL